MNKKIKLNNGLEMPQLGLGVYQIPEGQATYDAVSLALRLGYRHIDTAHAYQNEKSVGQAINDSGIERNDIWVTSKLWPTEYADPTAIDRMLKRLGLERIDLVLLHQQVGNVDAGWKMLEKAYLDGKVKAIGISNFDGPRLTKIFDSAKIKPQIIQVEMHPYQQQKDLKAYLAPYRTVMEAWYPLGHGDKVLLEEPLFAELGEKYGKSAAQIILRWHLQEGIVIFPRSTSEVHLAENLDVYDFELEPSELTEIEAMDKNKAYFELPYEEQVQRFLAWTIED